MRTHDTRIRKEDIQPSVPGDGIVYHALDGCFVCGIEFLAVDGYVRPGRGDFSLVCGQMRVGVVADVDGAGAVLGELVCSGAADAEGGVGASYYNYFPDYTGAIGVPGKLLYERDVRDVITRSFGGGELVADCEEATVC